LCAARFGVSARTLWGNWDDYREHGAAWLVNFSDCEGYIDAPTAARILTDLKEHEAQIRRSASITDEPSWYVEQLDKWLAALEMAADGGMLDFH